MSKYIVKSYKLEKATTPIENGLRLADSICI